MRYEMIDHTADLGVRVYGENLPALFMAAAAALFDLIAGKIRPGSPETAALDVSGADWPDLLVNWLRELLFLWTGRERLLGEIVSLAVSPYRVRAEVSVSPYDPERHEIAHDIKAVTYHAVQVTKTPDGWTAQVIFDV